jgi:hypothetical protein
MVSTFYIQTPIESPFPSLETNTFLNLEFVIPMHVFTLTYVNMENVVWFFNLHKHQSLSLLLSISLSTALNHYLEQNMKDIHYQNPYAHSHQRWLQAIIWYASFHSLPDISHTHTLTQTHTHHIHDWLYKGALLSFL